MAQRQYYTASVKKVTATNAKSMGGFYQYDSTIETIEEKVLFYYNRMNVLLRKDNKNPVILEDELYDFFQDNFTRNPNGTYSYCFVSVKDLTPVFSEGEKKKTKLKSIFKKI